MYIDQPASVYQVIQTPVYSANTNSGSSDSGVSGVSTTSGPVNAAQVPIINSSDSYKKVSNHGDGVLVDDMLSEEQRQAEVEVNAAVYGKILSR